MNHLTVPGHNVTGQIGPDPNMTGQDDSQQQDPDRCMVAVVRGLRDSGLAVTVTDNRGFNGEVVPQARRYEDQYIARQNADPVPGISLNPNKSSCTQTRGQRQRPLPYYASTRALDDQYISTYQAAHGISPSYSAPIRPEFNLPRNSRIEPVAARSYIDAYRPSFESFLPVRDTHLSQHDAPWVERGIALPMPGCPHDLFAASLRKYPMTTVECSASAELINRLLTYGHARNLTKSSYHSKSLRSLRHAQEPTRDSRNLVKKESKNIQTYTKTRNDSSSQERERDRDSDNARKRKRNNYSPGNVASDISARYEDEIYHYSYDYLKPTHRVARTKIRRTRPARSSSHLSVGSSDMHNTPGVDGTDRSSHVRPETSAQESALPVDAPTRSNNIRTEPTSRSSTPRGSPERKESIPQFPSLRSAMTPKGSILRTDKSTPRSSPVRTEISPRSSPVRTEGLRVNRDGYRFPNKTEVRYLNDVTRYVRDAIRHIYEEQPQTCSRISNRYHQHRREYHRSGPAAIPDWTNMECQTSPRSSRDKVSNSRTVSIGISTKCSPTRKPCKICHKPLPCGCSKSPKKIRFHSPPLCANVSNPCNVPHSDIDEGISDREYVNLKISDVIYDWLQEIPVYASYSPNDRCERERIISTLIHAIKHYYGKDNFENLAKEEILKCLSELPMWYPNKKDKDEFRREYAEKLIRKLRNVKSKRDRFGEIVAKWFKQLCFKITHDGKPVEKQKILKDLTKRLRSVAFKKHTTEEEYYNLLKEETYEIVDQLPLEVQGDKSIVNRKLADDLVSRLAEIPSKDVKKRLDYEPQNEFEWEILDWVEDLPEFITLTEKEGKHAIKRLAKKLKELKCQGLKYEEVHDQMEVAINDWVQSLQGRRPVDLEFELQQDILGWMELVPELDPSQSENETFSKKLAEQLNILQKEGFENENIQDQILSQIKNALNSELERKNKKLDVKNKNRLAINLLERIENTLEKQKRKQLLPSLLRKKIVTWFNDIPGLASENPSQKLELEEVTQKLIKDIYQLQREGVDENIYNEMLEKIEDVYDSMLTKRNIQFTPKRKKLTSEKLLHKILKLIKNIENDHLPEKQLHNNIQIEMMDVIENFFQYSSMTPDEKNEIENIVHNIAKNMTLIAIEGTQDEDVRETLSEEIKIVIEQINEIKRTEMEENTKNEIVDTILNNVVTAIHKIEKKIKLPHEYEKEIASWLKNIDELSKTVEDTLENKIISSSLAKKLFELQARGIDNDSIRDQMKDEMQKHLEETLDKRGKHLSPRNIDKYVENLMLQLIKLTQNVLKSKIATKERQQEFEKDIMDWLDDIPQLAGHTPEEKANNLRLSVSVAKNLNRWHHEGLEYDDTRDKMLKDIKSYMDLGMEERGQHLIDPRDKEELAEQLLDKIIHKTELIESKKTIPDEIQKEINKWIKIIPELKDSSNAGKKQIEDMVQQLTSQIIELRSMKMDSEQFKIAALDLIISTLGTLLEKKSEHMNAKAKQRLAESLFENIFSAIKKAEQVQVPTIKMQKEVQRDINDWLEDIPEVVIKTPEDKKDIEKVVQRLTKNLLNLRSEGIHDDQIQHKMLKDLKDELNMFLEKRGERMNSIENLEFVEKLYDKVLTTADKNEKILKMPNMIKDDVIDWIESIPELESSSPVEKTQNEQWARSFAKILQNILSKYADANELHNQCLKIAKAELELALQRKGKQLSPNSKNQVAEKLVDKIIKRKKQVEKTSIPTKAIEKEFKEDIETWLYDIPEIPLGKKRDEFSQKLAKDLNKIPVEAIHDEKVQKQMLDKINFHSEDALGKHASKMSEEQKTQLHEELLATLTTSGDAAFKKQQLANTDIQKNIDNWVDEISELASTRPSEKKDNEEMSHRLGRKLHDMKSMGFCDKNTRDQMMKEIKHELNTSLEKKGETLSPATKNKLAEKLLKNIYKTIEESEDIEAPKKTIVEVYQKEISEWMEAVPELAIKGLSDKKENEEFIIKLSQKLTELKTTEMDHTSLREKMLEEIKNNLETVLESKSETMNSNTKDKLANILFYNLVGASETVKMKLGEKHINDKVKRNIKNWIEDIEELDTVDNYKKRILNKEMQQTLKNFKGQDMNDLAIHEAAINEIKEHLESSLGKKMLDDKNVTALAEKLLDQTLETMYQYGKRHEMAQLIYMKILEWFQCIPETSSNLTTEQKQLENISRTLALKITVLFAKGIDDEETLCQVLVEIKDCLDHALEIRGNQIEPSDKSKLCEELLHKLVKSLERMCSKNKPIVLDEISENEIKNEITHWILENPDLPFDNSDINDIEVLSEGLVKKVNKMVAEGVPFRVMESIIIADITKELDKLCEKKGIKLDPIKKKQIAKNLFDNISKSIKKKQKIFAAQSNKPALLSPKYETEIKKELTDWILNNPDVPLDKSDLADIEILCEKLSKKFNKLQSEGMSDDEIKIEIIGDIMKELHDIFKKKGITMDSKKIREIAENMYKSMLKSMKNKQEKAEKDKKARTLSSSQETDLQNEITSWITNDPRLPFDESDLHDIKIISEKLEQKINKLHSEGVPDEIIKSEIIKDLINELDMLCKKKGIQLDPKQKIIIAETLFDKIIRSFKEKLIDMHSTVLSWLRALPGFHSPLSSKEGAKISRIVLQWFSKIKEFSGGSQSENQLLTDTLAREILRIIHFNLSVSSRRNLLQSEIGGWLGEIACQKDVQLKKCAKDNYINSLMKDLPLEDQTSRSSTSTQRPLYKMEKKICICPTDLYYVGESTNPMKNSSRKDSIEVDETLEELSKDLDEHIKKKITTAIARNLDILNTSDAVKLRDELTDILKEAKLEEEETRILSKKIIKAARTKGRSTGINVPRPENSIKQDVKRKVKEVLDSYNVTQNRESIESNVTDFITPIIMAGENVNKEGVLKPLNETGIPNDKVNEMADKIIRAVQTIPLDEKRQLPWTPMEIDGFKEKFASEMEDFINSITGKLDPEDKIKVNEAITRANQRIAEILADNNMSLEEKKALVKEELLKELQGLPITSDVPLEELANRLTCKAMTIADGAKYSTPRESWDESMAEQREQEYLNQVVDAIKNWVENIPIDPEIQGNENFQEMLIKDLACDIVDRQKYLQLHPEAKRCDPDEMERVKYQTYRWLNKFLEPKDLTNSVAKVPILMKALKNIPAPQLIRPGKRRSRLPKGIIPTYQEALEDEILMWIDNQPCELLTANDEDTKQRLTKELSMIVQAHKGRCNSEESIQNDIINWLPRIYNNASCAELNRSQEELQRLLKNKGFTDDSWTPSIDTSQFIDDNLNSILLNWLRKMPFYQKRNHHERQEQESLVIDLSKALKGLVDCSNGENIEEQLIEETSQRLKDIVIDTELKNDEIYLRKVAVKIFDYVRKQHISSCCSTPPPDRVLDDVVHDWISGIQLCPRSCQQKQQLESKKRHFITCLENVRLQHDVTSCQHEPSVMGVIDQFMNSIVDPCRRNDERYMSDKTSELLRHLRTVPVELNGSCAVYTPKVFRKPTDVLFEDVDKWCQNLPIHVGESPEEQEKVQTFKHNIACKLVNKIGELNINPEIFNDEFLYEDILADEIDKILEDLPRNPELDKYLPPLKMDLIYKIKESRQRIRNDLAGKAYKQQLRDTVSSSIYMSESLSAAEEASFEILKDNLADAYINLHFVTDNEDDKNRYKQKILQEICRFCQKFLLRHPCSPIDPNKINSDLYCALQRVPVPRDESMKSEVEQSRAKDVINDWLNDLRLKEESGSELLHRNKMAIILAKRVQEIERQKESDPLLEHGQKIVDEATKFLRKLSLGSQEAKIPEWAEMLRCRLKCSEKTRKFDVNRPFCAQSQTDSCFIRQIPPCGLSMDERAHLQKVRDRYHKPTACFRDASVCPSPMDVSSQTNVRCWDMSHGQRQGAHLRNSGCQTRSHLIIRATTCDKRDASSMTPIHTPTQSGYDITPRVVVKEYLWDSGSNSRPYNQSPPSACVGTQHEPPLRTHIYRSPPSPRGGSGYPSPCIGIQQGQSFTQRSLCSNNSVSKQKYCKYTTTQSQETLCPRHYQQRCRPAEAEESSEEYQEDLRPCRRPRVTRLGSSDSEGACGSRSRRRNVKRETRRRNDEDSECSDPDRCEDMDYRAFAPCRASIEQGSCRRLERRVERSPCKCKDRIITSKRKNQGTMYQDTCTACGTKCPHPSYMYFK